MFTSIASQLALTAWPCLAWMPGWQEILIIVIVVLILFGGRKIPELAKGLGKGLREFKREMSGIRQDFEQAAEEVEDEDDYDRPRPKKRRKKPRPKPEATAQAHEEPDEGEQPEDAEPEKEHSGADQA